MNLGFHKWLEMSPSEQLLATQEGYCSMELGKYAGEHAAMLGA
jgi:hypothetical protein